MPESASQIQLLASLPKLDAVSLRRKMSAKDVGLRNRASTWNKGSKSKRLSTQELDQVRSQVGVGAMMGEQASLNVPLLDTAGDADGGEFSPAQRSKSVGGGRSQSMLDQFGASLRLVMEDTLSSSHWLETGVGGESSDDDDDDEK